MKTRRVRRQSLRRQILLRTLVVGLVPLIILAAVAVLGLVNLSRSADDSMANLEARLAEDSALSRLSSEAASAGRELDLGLAQRVGQLQAWARDPMVRTSAAQGTADASTYLSDELGRQPEFLSARYTDRTGTVIGSTDATAAVDRRESVLWQRAWNESVGVDPIADLDGRPILPIAVAIADNAGRPIGVLEADLDLDVLQSILGVRAGQGVALSLVSDERVLLARADADVNADGDTNADSDATASDGWTGARPLDSDELDEGTTEALRTGEGTLLGDNAVFAFAPVDFAVTLGGASNSSTAPAWLLVASQPNEAAFASLASLEDLDGQIDQATTELAVVVLIVLLFGGFVAVAMAARMSHAIVGPVNQLIKQADHTAQIGIPEAVSTLMEEGPDAVEIDHLDVRVEASNELTALATSFNTVQRRALQLAGGQAAMRHNTLEMIGHLGRHNQRLVKRQLSFLDELERAEEDPARLSSLFTLDHLATRMRRSAESFLVIAGHRAPSKRSAPVRVELVVQGALAEVEHFERVDASQVEPVALAGRAVTDVAHILAELMENAISASPPDRPVELIGARGADGYSLTIRDRGLGMTDEALAEANHILTSDTDLYLTPTRQLGLTVVSKLAKRYDLTVALKAGADGGLAASVSIPTALVEPAEAASAVPGMAATPEPADAQGPAPDIEHTVALRGSGVDFAWPPPTIDQASPLLDADPVATEPTHGDLTTHDAGLAEVDQDRDEDVHDAVGPAGRRRPPAPVTSSTAVVEVPDPDDEWAPEANDWPKPTRAPRIERPKTVTLQGDPEPPTLIEPEPPRPPVPAEPAQVTIAEAANGDDPAEPGDPADDPMLQPIIDEEPFAGETPVARDAPSSQSEWVESVVGSVLEAESSRGPGPSPTASDRNAVPRRVSRRIPGSVDGGRAERHRTKRSVATSESTPQVEAEADAVRSRWHDFQRGRAAAGPEAASGVDDLGEGGESNHVDE
ncbi:MAG: cache domain-containing protein [Actinomycetota bacterium]